MSKKKAAPKKRFKVTTEDDRVYFIYATDVLQATQLFKDHKPDVDAKGNPLSLVLAKIEEDTGEWKTKLQDGRVVTGG